jgi:hypothetical protein
MGVEANAARPCPERSRRARRPSGDRTLPHLAVIADLADRLIGPAIVEAERLAEIALAPEQAADVGLVLASCLASSVLRTSSSSAVSRAKCTQRTTSNQRSSPLRTMEPEGPVLIICGRMRRPSPAPARVRQRKRRVEMHRW